MPETISPNSPDDLGNGQGPQKKSQVNSENQNQEDFTNIGNPPENKAKTQEEPENVKISERLNEKNEFVEIQEAVILAESVIDGSWAQSQEALRARERYGRKGFISSIKEFIGGERIGWNPHKDVAKTDLTKGEIVKGKERRWLNPLIKGIIGGGALAAGIFTVPAWATALVGLGAGYLTRAGVESFKLWKEKKLGIRNTIENSYVAKYNKAIELSKQLLDNLAEKKATNHELYYQQCKELIEFIKNSDSQAISQYEQEVDVAELNQQSIEQLEEKQQKFEKKWKLIEDISAFVAGVGAAAIYSLTIGKAKILEELLKKQYDFDGDGIAHTVQKTKEGWVYLYNNISESVPRNVQILNYGKFGAHVLGGNLDKFFNAQVGIQFVKQLVPVLVGTIGALGLQTAYRVGELKYGEKAAKNISQERRNADQFEKILEKTEIGQKKFAEEKNKLVQEKQEKLVNFRKQFKPGQVVRVRFSKGKEAIITNLNQDSVSLKMIDIKNQPNIELNWTTFQNYFQNIITNDINFLYDPDESFMIAGRSGISKEEYQWLEDNKNLKFFTIPEDYNHKVFDRSGKSLNEGKYEITQLDIDNNIMKIEDDTGKIWSIFLPWPLKHTSFWSQREKMQNQPISKQSEKVRQETSPEVTTANLNHFKELSKKDSLETQESYEASLDKVIEVLKNQGGIVELKENVPTIVIPDIHARREMLFNILDKNLVSKDNKEKKKIFDFLKEGKINIVCLGDGMHSEVAENWTWSDNNDPQKQIKLEEEMIKSLGAMKMIMDLKSTFPENFHYIRGNHDNILGQEGDMPGFAKYNSESINIKQWVENKYGRDFLNKYASMEKNLPLLAKLNKSVVFSHTAPSDILSSAQINDRNPAVLGANYNNNTGGGLTWTDNTRGQTSQEKVEGTLHNIGADGAKWIIGHRPTGNEKYREQFNGKLIQINDPNKGLFAIIQANKTFDPKNDIKEV